jgi:hypothetical protein
VSAKLREAMTAVAQASPAVRVPAGLFDKARRRRRAQLAGGALMVAVLAGIASLGLTASGSGPPPRPASGTPDRHPPAVVARAPKWVADLRDAPLGAVQFAYVEPDREGNDARLIVVSGDRYRWADLGAMLSPDGRYLAYRVGQMTKLLDVSTGAVALLAEGEPMVWSRAGDFLVLRRSLGTQDHMELNVVSVPSGVISWSIEMVPPCLGNRVSLSPDADSIALSCLSTGTYLYRRGRGLDWHVQGRELAGPQAWAPDGRTIATWAVYGDIYYLELFLLDIADGSSVGTIPTPKGGVAEVVAWYGGLPVTQGQDWVEPLSSQPGTLMRVESANRLMLAAEAMDFAGSRPQGRIDAGPLLARYRGLLPQVYLGLFLAITLAWVLIARRIRRRRRLR